MAATEPQRGHWEQRGHRDAGSVRGIIHRLFRQEQRVLWEDRCSFAAVPCCVLFRSTTPSHKRSKIYPQAIFADSASAQQVGLFARGCRDFSRPNRPTSGGCGANVGKDVLLNNSCPVSAEIGLSSTLINLINVISQWRSPWRRILAMAIPISPWRPVPAARLRFLRCFI